MMRPMGDQRRPSVRIGNLLTGRCMVLLLLACAKKIWVTLEQPGTSLMELHVLFQRFCRLVEMRRLRICMADFGAPSLKPTLLYSSNLFGQDGEDIFIPTLIPPNTDTPQHSNDAYGCSQIMVEQCPLSWSKSWLINGGAVPLPNYG